MQYTVWKRVVFWILNIFCYKVSVIELFQTSLISVVFHYILSLVVFDNFLSFLDENRLILKEQNRLVAVFFIYVIKIYFFSYIFVSRPYPFWAFHLIHCSTVSPYPLFNYFTLSTFYENFIWYYSWFHKLKNISILQCKLNYTLSSIKRLFNFYNFFTWHF